MLPDASLGTTLAVREREYHRDEAAVAVLVRDRDVSPDGARDSTGTIYLLFLFVSGHGWQLWLLYFFISQATNGTWSGAGYAYWGESFPSAVAVLA